MNDLKIILKSLNKEMFVDAYNFYLNEYNSKKWHGYFPVSIDNLYIFSLELVESAIKSENCFISSGGIIAYFDGIELIISFILSSRNELETNLDKNDLCKFPHIKINTRKEKLKLIKK